jgi:hypothetical protein
MSSGTPPGTTATGGLDGVGADGDDPGPAASGRGWPGRALTSAGGAYALGAVAAGDAMNVTERLREQVLGIRRQPVRGALVGDVALDRGSLAHDHDLAPADA